MFYTTTIRGKQILHLKVCKFATKLCVKFYNLCKAVFFALQLETFTLGSICLFTEAAVVMVVTKTRCAIGPLLIGGLWSRFADREN